MVDTDAVSSSSTVAVVLSARWSKLARWLATQSRRRLDRVLADDGLERQYPALPEHEKVMKPMPFAGHDFDAAFAQANVHALEEAIGRFKATSTRLASVNIEEQLQRARGLARRLGVAEGDER